MAALAFDLPHRRSLLMAIKEALNNAVKYSAATELRLQIRWRDQRLVVVVLDNGKGFAPEAIKPERNGLTNMAQRMTELGGHCRVTSRPGKGCRVEFCIPLKDPRRHTWIWAWNPRLFTDQSNETRNAATTESAQERSTGR